MKSCFRPLRLVILLLLLAMGSAHGTNYTYTKLHAFAGTDGAGPEGTLIEGSDGNFYGTTSGDFYAPKSGANAAANGTIFKLTPAGQVTTLHVFAGGSAGSNPTAPLVQLANGLLYGTTTGGFGGSGPTIFILATDGTAFKTLDRDSAAVGTDDITLAKGTDGNIYGTDRQGGTLAYGTIFQLAPDGTRKTLYSFRGHPDGEFPNGPLCQASDGNFYGCTGAGGVNDEGTIFRISPTGVYKQIHALAAEGVQGSGPFGLVQAGDGNLYGACQQGGNENYPPSGTVFRVTTTGAFTKLLDLGYGFGEFPPRPVDPVASLVVGPDGALYGTGKEGGVTGTGYGGVFRMTTAGAYSSVFGFNGTNGAYPFAGLLLGSDGNFYGVTAGKIAETDDTSGGDQHGTIFRLSAPSTVAPVITSAATATGKAGEAFSYQVTASGSPTSYGATTLPAGLSLDGATGLISGTPTVAGEFTVTISAANAHGTGAKTLTITLAAPVLRSVTVVATTPVTFVGSDTPGEFTFHISATPAVKTVVHYTLKGSAINGTDYDFLTGKLKFKPGKGTTKTVSVIPRGDLGGEESKKVKLVIVPDPSVFTDATPGPVKIKIKQ